MNNNVMIGSNVFYNDKKGWNCGWYKVLDISSGIITLGDDNGNMIEAYPSEIED